jgi:8-oxo-dGTP diphosphatase
MTQRRQITAYGLLAPDDEPLGGAVAHGEHPANTVVRWAAELTGQTISVSRVLDVSARLSAGDGVELHDDRIVFAARPSRGGAVPPRPAVVEGRPRVQRFAAYGLVTDPDGRLLLTQIADGYPGAGRWHLPGGGTDFGEQPAEGLLRELYEETAQSGVVAELLGVSHRHNPAALGPEGYPIDWHTVRTLHRVRVPAPGQPRVTEAAGGSTVAAAWFAPEEAGELALTEVAKLAIADRDRADDRGR